MAQNPEVVHGGGPTHHHNLVGQSAMVAHSGDAVMAGEGHTVTAHSRVSLHEVAGVGQMWDDYRCHVAS